MPFRLLALLAFAPLLALGCSSALHVPGAASGSSYVMAPDGSESSVAPGSVRLRPAVCDKIDLKQDERALDETDFARFLESQGWKVRIVHARADLAYVDILDTGSSAPIRFRVAVLPNAGAAGRDLHVALLQHGQGTWGVHRSNLAVLAPQGSYDDIVACAARTRIACWGVLTLAGLDDTYVIPGGYTEL